MRRRPASRSGTHHQWRAMSCDALKQAKERDKKRKAEKRKGEEDARRKERSDFLRFSVIFCDFLCFSLIFFDFLCFSLIF